MLGFRTVIGTLGPRLGWQRWLVPTLALLLTVLVGGQGNAAILACSGTAKQCDECPADNRQNQSNNSHDSQGNLACVESCGITAAVTPQTVISSSLTVVSWAEAPMGPAGRAFTDIENPLYLDAAHWYHGSRSLQSLLCVFLN